MIFCYISFQNYITTVLNNSYELTNPLRPSWDIRPQSYAATEPCLVNKLYAIHYALRFPKKIRWFIVFLCQQFLAFFAGNSKFVIVGNHR